MNAQFESFGHLIHDKRVECGITLRQLADGLNISIPYLSDIEKDRRNPPEEKLIQLAAILSLTEEEKNAMHTLAGKARNAIPTDLPDYIKPRDYVVAGLRTARDLDADEKDWLRFVEELRKRKGKE